jgi:hypothetical protein
MKHLNMPFVRLDQTMAPTECSSRLEELLNAHEPGSLGQKLETKVFQQLVSEEMAFSSASTFLSVRDVVERGKNADFFSLQVKIANQNQLADEVTVVSLRIGKVVPTYIFYIKEGCISENRILKAETEKANRSI